MGDGFTNLIERLLDIRRNNEDGAEVTDRERFPQVDAQLETVGPIEGRDLADALRAEAGAGAVGGAAVEWRTKDGDVVLSTQAHIFKK
jgi:hypothetical protein